MERREEKGERGERGAGTSLVGGDERVTDDEVLKTVKAGPFLVEFCS